MKVRTLKNGIFLKENRRRTKRKGITPILPKGDMIYPLEQLSGIPAIPIVHVGEYVYKGQKIAEAPGVSSASIHASVSGRIKSIEPNFVPEGARGNCIIIENDGEYKEHELTDIKPLEELSRLEILDYIDEAGIVNLGADECALKEKLCPKDPEQIQYIVMDGTEEEPYFTANYRRMIENPNEIIAGIKCVLTLFENAKGVLLVEKHRRKCIKKLKKAIKHQKNIIIRTVKGKYPQLTEVGDVGERIVLNPETLIAIQQAVLYRKPVTERVLTISGKAVGKPGNYKVLLGTNLEHLLEDVCIKEGVEQIILGGAMKGFVSSSWDVPITKEFSSIVCLEKDDYKKRESSACIQCGRCAQACPKQLVPTKLACYADKGKERRFLRRKGSECIACGACNYVCPAKRQLKQSITSSENGAPHMNSRINTTKIMFWVLLALLPTMLFGVMKYGLPALGVLFVTIITAIHSELLWQLIWKKKITVGDLSAVLTGLLLGLNLPADTPLWICSIGSFLAIILFKQLFGGLGKNLINPAMSAKAVLIILFAKHVMIEEGCGNLLDSFLGNVDATIGGSSVICILLGAILLLVKGIIDIRIPGICLAVYSFIVTIFGGHGFDAQYLAETLCNGSLLLMVWFMAVDYSTSPITKSGKIIYGILLGGLTGVCMVLGYVNVMPFALITCNLMVPFLELITLPRTSLKKITE